MYQHTIKQEIEFSDIGIHSGKKVFIKIKPAPVNKGIVFLRKDINAGVEIPALVENVSSTFRGTSLSVNNIEVKTVEHLLSCLYGLFVDNAFIEVSGPEIPIMDGSSLNFVEAINSNGFLRQDALRNFYKIDKTLSISQEDSHIIVLPYDGFKITYVIDYEHPVLKTQMEEIVIDPRTYIKHISLARTYGFMEEVQILLDNHLALGGNLDNALIINKEGYSTPLRCKNEPVKHKILDLIGDLSLLGSFLKGHVIAIKSGHKLNVELVKILKAKT